MIDRNLDDLDSLTESAGGSSPRRIVLWLVIASLLVLLLPLFLVSNALKDENVRMQQEMETIQATLDSPVPVPAAEQTLRDEMLQSREAETVLENLRADLESRHLNWPDTMLTLGNFDPTQIRITGLAQTERRLTITGQAVTENQVMNYSQALRDSGWFQTVLIQSISQIELPTATPLPRDRNSTEPTPIPPTPVQVAEFMLQVDLKAETPGG